MKNCARIPSWIRISVVAAAVAFFGGSHPQAQQPSVVTVAPEDVTYIMPVYEQYGSGDLPTEIAKLRDAIGPEGPYVKIGFTVYVFPEFGSWSVDPNDADAVKANLASTIAAIDENIARANAAGVPICMSFLTRARGTYDDFQHGAENADVRNTQWLGGPDSSLDNTISGGWMSLSQYAREYRRRYGAYVRELGKVVANRMANNPLFVCAAGDGEIELSYEQTIFQPGGPKAVSNAPVDTWLWADYSPFAIAEFRDWITARGMYAPGQPFAGQAYSQAAAYPQTAAGLAKLNTDFAQSFTSWDLKYFNWVFDNGNEVASAIPIADYNAKDAAARHAISTTNGFDAPRVRNWNSAWWQLWLEFRRSMVHRHNVEFAKWITTTPDDDGHTVPAFRWYGYQIPADRLLSNTPDDQFNYRYETSGSGWSSADLSPYGRIGTTSFNVYYYPSPGQCWTDDPRWTNINTAGEDFPPNSGLKPRRSFCRTMANMAPEIAKANRRFGVFEWHPAVGNAAAIQASGLDPYGAEMDLVLKYRPSVLAPYALYRAPSSADEEYPFYDAPAYIAALKSVIAKLNLGIDNLGSPDPKVVIDTVAAASTNVAQPFALTGYALDIGTLLGTGWGTGVEKVDVYAKRGSEAEVLLGPATYGAARTDASALYGGQFLLSGFSYNVTGLRPGTYTVRVEVTSKNVKSPTPVVTSKTTSLTIPSTAALTIEAPSNGTKLQPFNITGWTVDPSALPSEAGGTGINTLTVTAAKSGGPTTTLATLGTGDFLPRVDIGSCGSGQFKLCGFNVPVTGLTPGTYTFTMTAHTVVDDTTVIKTASVTIPASNASLKLESPANNGTTGFTFNISGWAIDQGDPTGTGIDQVQVYAFPKNSNGTFGAAQLLGAATYGAARAEIGSQFGARFTNSGFSLSATLAAGSYRLIAYGHSLVNGSTFDDGKFADITVAAPVSNLQFSIDGPSPNQVISTQPFLTGGWAVDLNSTSGPGVDAFHVYTFNVVNGVADPSTGKFVTSGSGGGSRPDVAAIFGSQFAPSGFTFSLSGIAPGTYDLGIYFHSSVTNQFYPKFVRITVPTPPAPVHNSKLSLDGPQEGQVINRSVTPNFITGGWAVDLGATSGVGVDAIHVYAFPVVNGVVGAGVFIDQAGMGPRPDVAAVFGSQFLNSGFTFVFNATLLTPGEWYVGVYVHSSVTGAFDANDPGQTKFVKVTIE